MIGWAQIVQGLLALVKQQTEYIHALGGTDMISHNKAMQHIREIERVVDDKIAAGD